MISSPTKKPAQFSAISVLDRGRIKAPSLGPLVGSASTGRVVAGSSRWSFTSGMPPGETRDAQRQPVPRPAVPSLFDRTLVRGLVVPWRRHSDPHLSHVRADGELAPAGMVSRIKDQVSRLDVAGAKALSEANARRAAAPRGPSIPLMWVWPQNWTH